MKIVISSLILSLSLLAQTANAQPFVCFNGVSPARHSMLESEDLLMLAAIRCEEATRLQMGLTAVSIVLSATGLGLACTGIGAPVAVYLEGGALGIEILSLTVGLLPCDDSANEAKVKKLTEEVVCSQLESMGTPCRLRRP